jgi:two-component system alkaline phosphatase synthesis response regulator PhoP
VSRKILIADDEAHIRHVLSMKLSNAGYEVVMATDGEEALEVARAESPDLICTDYQMPYMTGVELCQKLHEDERTAGIPLLMLTARGFEFEDGQIAELGLADVLSKPFSPREMLQKVQDLIGPPESDTDDLRKKAV